MMRDHFDSKFQRLAYRWVVPVHKGDCHQEIGRHANAAAYYVFCEFLSARHTFESRDRLAKWFHDKGLYWYSVFLHLDMIGSGHEDPDLSPLQPDS